MPPQQLPHHHATTSNSRAAEDNTTNMNSTDIERCRKRIVQYLWDPEPKNDEEPDMSLWCLGIEYPPTELGNTTPSEHNSGGSSDHELPKAALNHVGINGWPEAFLLDFESRIWMTYRSNFPPISRIDSHSGNSSMTLGVRLRSQLMEPQGFTSDTGWGCMIRSGQSLLANAMAILALGRGWRRGKNVEEEAQLLSLFADSPDAPFSIHRFVQHGAESCGKYPGEWFGPSATARCIRSLSAHYEPSLLRVYLTDDTSDVYQDRFLSISRDEQGDVRPTLVLMGTRLGIDHITPAYWDGLKAMLQFPQSVGIAGGRPSASHYFIGAQGSHFFYLDPHTTRPALPYRKADVGFTSAEVDTYHTRRLRRIHVQDMDPSMLIGFLIKDEEDWQDWKSRVASATGKPIINIRNEIDCAFPQGRREALDEVEVLDDTD